MVSSAVFKENVIVIRVVPLEEFGESIISSGKLATLLVCKGYIDSSILEYHQTTGPKRVPCLEQKAFNSIIIHQGQNIRAKYYIKHVIGEPLLNGALDEPYLLGYLLLR